MLGDSMLNEDVQIGKMLGGERLNWRMRGASASASSSV